MAFKVDNTAIYNTPGGDLQGFSRVMTRPTARVRGVSKCRGSGRVGSGHYVLKSHGSGRVGSRSFESRGSVWVGSRGFKISRVGSGRVGSGRGGSGRVGADRVGSRGLEISRVVMTARYGSFTGRAIMTRGLLFADSRGSNPRISPADSLFSTLQLPAGGPLSCRRPAGRTRGSDPRVRK